MLSIQFSEQLQPHQVHVLACHVKMKARALNKAMDICASVQTGLLESSVKQQYVSQCVLID